MYNNYNNNENEKKVWYKNKYGNLNGLGITLVISMIGFILIIIIGLIMFAIPKYSVWQKELKGKALLKEAKFSKKIAIEEAKANLESEKLNAEAEVERAKGMAKAMEVENGKLTDTYIKYLWVKNMNSSQNSKVYIPTEAGIPILEAK